MVQLQDHSDPIGQDLVEKTKHKNVLLQLVKDLHGNNHPVAKVNRQYSPVVHHPSHKATDHTSPPLLTANRFDVIAGVSDMDTHSKSPAPGITPQTSKCSEDVPLVEASVHSTPIEIFLDTGSPVNIINKDLITKLELTDDIVPSSIILSSVSSNSLSIEGEISLTIQIRGNKLTLPFIVVRSCVFPGDVMIGFQSMRENDIKLDPSNLTIKLGGKTIPLTSKCVTNSGNLDRPCKPFHALSRNVASCIKPTVHVNIGSGRFYTREPKDNERHLTIKPLLSDGFVVTGTNIQPNSNKIVKIRLRFRGYLNASTVPDSCKKSNLNIEPAIYSIDQSDDTVHLRVANVSDQQVTLRANSMLLEFNLLKD